MEAVINKNPLVTVVIPTYKRNVDILSRAINSVLNQQYNNVEIIVVDDNANAQEYREANNAFFENNLKNKKNIYFLRNEENIGGALSRNEGIKKANGYFVTFLDDDDYFLPQKISNQVVFMIENGLNCSFTDITLYNEKNEIIDRRVRNDILSFDKDSLIKYHLTKGITSTETFMVTKELLIKVGGFDDVKMGQEFYLMMKILHDDSLKIGYYSSDDIVAYRTKAESISNGPNKIRGERDLLKYRKQYFYMLNGHEKRYVKCRHRAVMAVSYKRRKNYFVAFLYLVFAFLTSPIISITEAKKLKKRIKSN